MIDFEEELKKFHPSLEVDEAESAIKQHDMRDLTDLMLELYRGGASVDVQGMQNYQGMQDYQGMPEYQGMQDYQGMPEYQEMQDYQDTEE